MPELTNSEPNQRLFDSMQQQQDFLLMSFKHQQQADFRPPTVDLLQQDQGVPLIDGSFTFESFKNELVVSLSSLEATGRPSGRLFGR